MHAIFRVVLLGGFPKRFFFPGREKTDDVWIGGGGSGGSGEYDCAHQTALYNTRNKKCLPESPLLLSVLFFRGRGSQGCGMFIVYYRPRKTRVR